MRQQQKVVEDYDSKLDELLNALQSQVMATVSTISRNGSFDATPVEPNIQNRRIPTNVERRNASDSDPNQKTWDQFLNPTTSQFNMNSDPHSQGQNQPISWTNFYDQGFSPYGDAIENTEMDWDALAVALDLPFPRLDPLNQEQAYF